MSSALARLRRWLDDPLLVKAKGGYVFTARALELAGPVRRILEDIELAVHPQTGFDPATSRRNLRIATNDAFMLAVVPALVEGLQREAPGLTLAFVPSGPQVPAAALESADIDLCIGHYAERPPGLHAQVLMEERLVGLARQHHPRIKRQPSLQQYAQAGHVLVSPQGNPFLAVAQAALADAGWSANIALQVPHVSAVPMVVARTDLISTLPERVARHYAQLLDLRLFKPPIEFPKFRVHALWHDRLDRDLAHQWFRAYAHRVCRSL